MSQLYAIFLSWALACICIFLMQRIFNVVNQISGRKKWVVGIGAKVDNVTDAVGLIDNKPCVIAGLPQELILLILRNIPYRTRPRLDLFTSVISASCPPRPRSFDIATVAAPLVCASWHGPGTEALYEHVTIYTGAQCVLLHRTLQDNPSLCPLIRFLCLPSPREASVVTPPSVIQLSADIVAACKNVQEVDVLQQNDFSFDPSDFPYLRSIRVSNVSTQPVVFIPTPLIRFRVQDLTLNGCYLSAQNTRIDAAWPEFPELKILRLENCVLEGEDLTQILSRTTTKLQSLALFTVGRPFKDWELPSSLADSLEELWIEDCWPLSFEHHFTSYSSLRSLHLDWHLFAKVVPFVPPNLVSISITVPVYVVSSAPDFDRFESDLQHISSVLPLLRVIQVLGQRGYPLLNDETELRRKLSVLGVNLVVELVYRGETRPYHPLSRRNSASPSETSWDEWLYM